MSLIVIFIAELIMLYFITGRLSRSIYSLFFLLTRNKSAASAIFSFIFLPGTAIHELAHLFTAEILRVPTGEISFSPELAKKDAQHEIRLGSLKLAKTDPLRRFLIGIAPVVWGLFASSLVIFIFQIYLPQFTGFKQRVFLFVLAGYLLFSISNTMFSSRKDIEGSEYFLPVVLLISVVLYFAGVRINLTGQILEFSLKILASLVNALKIILGVNMLLLLLNSLVLQAIAKFFKAPST